MCIYIKKLILILFVLQIIYINHLSRAQIPIQNYKKITEILSEHKLYFCI